MKLSQKYEDEQLELKAQIKNMKKIVAEEKSHELNADGFLKIVRKYSQIEELTLDILQEFIDKIGVYHREEIFGEKVQKIEIYYKLIGNVEIPKLSRKEEAQFIKYFCRSNKEKVTMAI